MNPGMGFDPNSGMSTGSMQVNRLICPQCNMADQAQKVSVAYENGFSQANSSGTLRGHNGYKAHTNMTSVSQTALSRTLAPPVLAKSTSPLVVCVITGVIVGIIGFATMGSSAGAGVVFLLFAVGFIALGIYLAPKAKAKAQARAALWNRAKSKWDTLFYCQRCGVVYVPGQSDFKPTSRIQEFISQ